MIERRTLSAAIGDLLHTATGRPVGVVEAPIAATYVTLLPYAIVYPLSGATFADTFGGVAIDVGFSYQVTSVGQNYEQTELLADRIRAALLNASDNPLTIAGVSVWARLPDTGPQQPVKAADELWSIDERFRINVADG